MAWKNQQGDDGTTLVDEIRLEKHNSVFHTIGQLDELSAVIGIAREYTQMEELLQVQLWLNNMTAAITTTTPSLVDPHEWVTQLESWITHYVSEIQDNTIVVVPSGGIVATHLHLARAVCRRCERSVSAATDPAFREKWIPFINRLSDFLFLAARASAVKEDPVVQLATEENDYDIETSEKIQRNLTILSAAILGCYFAATVKLLTM